MMGEADALNKVLKQTRVNEGTQTDPLEKRNYTPQQKNRNDK